MLCLDCRKEKRDLPNIKLFPKINLSLPLIRVKRNNLRDRILNILSFLSQSMLKDKDLFYDGQEIWEDLAKQGFSEEDIESALGHIERTSLQVPGPFWSEMIPVHRSFSPEELVKLSSKVRGYLWKLKSRGIIDHVLEDEIVQKAMNLEDPAGLREIKTVAALTIFGYEHRILVEKNSGFGSGYDFH